VFLVTDLDIGMNDWMCKRLQWDDSYRPDRGKCLTADELESVKKFSRYLDAEGDGIAARSLPGVHGHGAYFVRGSGHDKHGTYTEDADAYQEVVDRLARKFRLAATAVPAPEIRSVPGATVGIVSPGGCHAAVLEAIDRLRDVGIVADYMRIRAFPFDTPVRAFLDSHAVTFVVEQNRDAQLRSLLAIETGKPRDEMIPVLDYGGMPLTAMAVVSAVSGRLALNGVGPSARPARGGVA
jgi:2-oxoglutarate ferredoxin oxidoreductase subunit alpha